MGRRIKRTLPLGISEALAYDAASNLQSRKDFNGHTTTYTYDSVNRLLTKTPDASLGEPTVTFAYTPSGQRASMTDASGTTSYTYDQRDRLLTKATPQGTLTDTWDATGNLLSVRSSNANGTSVNYAYDSLRRLSTVTDNRLASGVTSYTYDAAGNLASFVYPNGVQHTYTYNTLNRLTNLTVAATSTLASYAYTLGAAGNRTGVTEFGGRTVAYTYDALYRLTGETISGGAVNGTIGYSYDPVGNRLTRSSTVAPVPAAAYAYDANDRLTTDTYDSNGSTTASGPGIYAYDFENRLKTVNGGAVSIIYDGDGNRVAETVSGVTTKYLVDDRNFTGYPQVVEELAGSAVQRVYTYGLSRISQSEASGVSFCGSDGHGNVRLLTDATGAVTDRYDYDAFGNITSRTGSTLNVNLYSGEQLDPNVGFYYLRARYLMPAVGRFLTLDSDEGHESEPRSLHKYLYASGDPVNRIDPGGNQDLVELSFATAIEGSLSVISVVGFACQLSAALSLLTATIFLTEIGIVALQLGIFGVKPGFAADIDADRLGLGGTDLKKLGIRIWWDGGDRVLSIAADTKSAGVVRGNVDLDHPQSEKTTLQWGANATLCKLKVCGVELAKIDATARITVYPALAFSVGIEATLRKIAKLSRRIW